MHVIASCHSSLVDAESWARCVGTVAVVLEESMHVMDVEEATCLGRDLEQRVGSVSGMLWWCSEPG